MVKDPKIIESSEQIFDQFEYLFGTQSLMSP